MLTHRKKQGLSQIRISFHNSRGELCQRQKTMRQSGRDPSPKNQILTERRLPQAPGKVLGSRSGHIEMLNFLKPAWKDDVHVTVTLVFLVFLRLKTPERGNNALSEPSSAAVIHERSHVCARTDQFSGGRRPAHLWPCEGCRVIRDF